MELPIIMFVSSNICIKVDAFIIINFLPVVVRSALDVFVFPEMIVSYNHRLKKHTKSI